MNLTGQTSEAVAALALVREGFEVSAPIFTSPAFDLVAKWGRAIHAIQVKGGTLFENGKTVQWHTCTNRRMYTPADCSYFGLVLIPRDEVWWVPIEEVIGKRSVCTNTDNDSLSRYRGNLDALKGE